MTLFSWCVSYELPWENLGIPDTTTSEILAWCLTTYGINGRDRVNNMEHTYRSTQALIKQVHVDVREEIALEQVMLVFVWWDVMV